MLKAVFWTAIVLATLIVGLGFAAARKSAGMAAPAVTDGSLPPCSSTPNCVSTEVDSQNSAYIEPIETQLTFEQLQEHLRTLGGQVTSTSDSLIQAEFRTRLFRFTDDMLLKYDNDAQLLRIRSSSRVGKSDLGACLLYTSPSPRDLSTSRMPSSA